jgi:hypothetical protein
MRSRRELDPKFSVVLRASLQGGYANMSNLETYREKALKCTRAANEVHGTAERVELLGLASIYMALADYVDARHERGDQERDTQKDS